MRKLFTCLLAAGCFGMTNAQTVAIKPQLSAATRQFLHAYHAQTNKKIPLRNFVYKNVHGSLCVSAFIKVTDGFDEADLAALNIAVGTKAGNIWTVQVPVESVESFMTLAGVSNIDMDMPVYPYLDAARKQTKADSAQSGIGLPSPMNGQNVIVGVIDAGFDFTHPTMFDTAHAHYRIKKVWAQKMPGMPPSGFPYGHEMTDTNVLFTRGFDTSILSHGTHVTGIAAGSGYGSNSANKLYRGMAYASDIYLVGIMPDPGEWLVAGESDIIDGMNYIYHNSALAGKPCVINLSWGSTIGPHDGTSLFGQACDAITGPGRIFVCAAGNNGQDTVHLGKAFTATDTTVSTFVTFSPYLDAANQKTWLDVWGDTGKAFSLNFRLYNGAATVDSTIDIWVADTTETFNLIGSNNDTCFVTVTMTTSEYNHKPHMLVYLYSRVPDNICLTAKAMSGHVNMWEGYVMPPEGYYGALKKLGYPWAVSGDVNMTVSDIGCTKSALTVGAYTSKTGFTNISGQSLYYPGASLYHIAPFSSFGPTEDGRVKPDITAPGFALASAINSYDTSYLPAGTNYNSIVSKSTVDGRDYEYAMLAGTSMASPCAAGIVAMLLQLNPTLTPDSVRNILAATAIKDIYTGALPAAGNSTWGHGKINAYAASRYVASTLSVSNTLTADPLDCILYPNPNKGGFTIDYNSKTTGPVSVDVYDVSGRKAAAYSWFVSVGPNSRSFTASGLSKGIYFTYIASGAGTAVIKMVVE